MVFRFDDISLNSDMEKVNEMTDFLLENGNEVWWCISPICQFGCGERVFRAGIKPYSSLFRFYTNEHIGIPKLRKDVRICSHGLVHIDHRLLDYGAQEMSIIVSCELLDSCTFVPPFHKWNKDTENICLGHDYDLIKYEDCWFSCEHNEFSRFDRWYLHPQSWTLETFKKWYGAVAE